MGLRHLPVVDKFNSVVGMITRKDLVEEALEETLANLVRMNDIAPYQPPQFDPSPATQVCSRPQHREYYY